MHPNAELIDRFYTAFAQRDAERMAACYATDATFEDAVFQLQGGDIAAMWRMLCAQGKDLRVEHDEVRADHGLGSARWEVRYTFQTGRAVHNRVEATFTFRDGRILTHRDEFPLWAWMRQALGVPGALFGWAPPMHGVLRRKAAAGLRAYIAANPGATQIGS